MSNNQDAASVLAARRERVMEKLPEMAEFTAAEFESAKGRGLHLFAKRRIRARARDAGFGLTEIMILMQIVALLWQLWQLRRKDDPAAPLAYDAATLSRLYDEAAT